MNGNETSKPETGIKVKDLRQILKVGVRECPFVLFTNIYYVAICMSDTVLGPDDIVIKKTKCLP